MEFLEEIFEIVELKTDEWLTLVLPAYLSDRGIQAYVFHKDALISEISTFGIAKRLVVAAVYDEGRGSLEERELAKSYFEVYARIKYLDHVERAMANEWYMKNFCATSVIICSMVVAVGAGAFMLSLPVTSPLTRPWDFLGAGCVVLLGGSLAWQACNGQRSSDAKLGYLEQHATLTARQLSTVMTELSLETRQHVLGLLQHRFPRVKRRWVTPLTTTHV